MEMKPAGTGHDEAPTVWNITEAVELRARYHPAALALILPDRVISYREFVTAVHSVAHRMLIAGLKAGQTVGVSMAQTGLHLITQLALARIGIIWVPVHPSLPEDRRLLVARRFQISCVISAQASYRLEGIPFLLLNGADLNAPVRPPAPSGSGPDSPCWIALSSGTSGDPKGVLCTHSYLLDRVGKSVYVRAPGSRLMPMDLNFGTGFGQAMRMLVAGGTVVLVPDMTPANTAYMVRSHAVTHWLLSPVMAEELLPLLVDEDVHFPSVGYLQVVGGMPSRRLIEALLTRFTPNVFVVYGTVEIGPISIATPELLRRVPESVGRLAPWARAEVVDDVGRPVPAGTVGRLRLKSQGMLHGYHLDPALTAERFRDGWYYPHDRARIDAKGLLYIEGREDEVLNIGGAKIYPSDIERVLETHPAVREAAVFLLRGDGPDRLAAALIPAGGMPVAEIAAWSRQRLGPVSPSALFYVDSLPRTPTGKVLRAEISMPSGEPSAS
jgi:acyl-coenzyme A synthetase/AMP-(fatty) acid ligase